MLNAKKNRKQKSLVRLIKLIKNSAVVFILQVLFPEKPRVVAPKSRMLGQIQEVEQNWEPHWKKNTSLLFDFIIEDCRVLPDAAGVVVVVDVAGSDV